MTKGKTLFRRVYDSLIEGRTQQAQRTIAEYLRTHPVYADRRD